MKKYEAIVTLFGNTAYELKEAVLENKKLHEEIKNLKEKSETPKSA